jgi:hypothetical protein
MHLFEFNDQPFLPESIRATIRDVCELCNSVFRSFNHVAARRALDEARKQNSHAIIELGAGTAPITRVLASLPESSGLTLVPCDLIPDEEAYRDLQRRYPGLVQPVFEAVDFTRPHPWDRESVAVLVGTFHHIHPQDRPRTLAALSRSVDHVMVFEPLRSTWLSMALTLFAQVPVLLLPVAYCHRPGRLRRVVWCWLVPVVPLIFLWDGLVSCIRQWSPERWRQELAAANGESRPPLIESGVNHMIVAW